MQKAHKAKGFQVISIGVDREFSRSLEFAKGFDPTFSIVADEESELMGLFDVYSMPATFVVDRQGVIRFKDTGFKPEEQLAKLRETVSGLLQ
jgi:peroxiredoxin